MPENKYKDKVSIIIPAYNEEDRILPSLRVLNAFCEASFQEYEIICVDDGSTDGTFDCICEKKPSAAVTALRLPKNRGKGFAVKHGMIEATGRYRFFTDADLPYHLDAFHSAMEAFAARGCDVVAGARELAESSAGIRVGMLRRIAGRVFSAFANAMVRMDVRDSQCGFKGFDDRATHKIFSELKTPGYAFDVEIFAIARSLQLEVCRIPVTLVKHAGSKIRMTFDPISMFIDLVRIAVRVRGHHSTGS